MINDIIFKKYYIFKEGHFAESYSSFIVMFVVFCLVAPIVRTSGVFRDLPKTYTFYDDIKYLTEKNIISGYPEWIVRGY